MTTLEPTAHENPSPEPGSTRSGHLLALLILGLLALVAIVVILTGRPAGDVAVALGPLMPVVWWLLGRRDRPSGGSGS